MNGNFSLLTLTVAASAAVAACRVITLAGAYPAAGAKGIGVTRTSGEEGDLLPVDVLGTTIAEAGAAIAADADLMADASGRVVPLTAGKVAIGRALEAAGAAGAQIEVLLLSTVVAPA